MSFADIVLTASARASSGDTVYRVPPLTRRMSLTFMELPLTGCSETNIAHNAAADIPRNPQTLFPPEAAWPALPTLVSTPWRCTPGPAPDPATGARAVPIHLSTSFVFENSDHAASLFNMERAGHVYSRISNPTNAVLEERIAALEGGIGAIATASGQAALHLAIATLAGAGSHIVSSSALYGGSHNLLHYTLARFGIEHHVRASGRHRRLARRDPPEHPAAVR